MKTNKFAPLCTELIPVGESASCSVRVEGSAGGELVVTVRGPRGEVPVRLAGDAVSGLVASFTPRHVGPHTLTAHYNNQSVPVIVNYKLLNCIEGINNVIKH